MGRIYKPKVKLNTELLIESAINEVGKGASTSATAKKYYMSTSLPWWRIMDWWQEKYRWLFDLMWALYFWSYTEILFPK